MKEPINNGATGKLIYNHNRCNEKSKKRQTVSKEHYIMANKHAIGNKVEQSNNTNYAKGRKNIVPSKLTR